MLDCIIETNHYQEQLKLHRKIGNVLFNYLSIKHADFFVAQLGSFFELRSQKAEAERLFEQKLKSEKFVVDLFLYRFFRFTLFGKYKPD